MTIYSLASGYIHLFLIEKSILFFFSSRFEEYAHAYIYNDRNTKPQFLKFIL